MNRLSQGNLKISSALLDFINNEVIPGTSIKPEDFWAGFDSALHELAPKNKKLLEKREEIQKKNR